MRITYIVAAAVAATAIGTAQPAAAQSRLAPRSAMAMKAEADSAVMAYIVYDPATFDIEAAKDMGVNFGASGQGVATIKVNSGLIKALGQMQGVRYVQTASPVAPMLDIVRPEVGADKVQAGTDLTQGFTGTGVVVGVVDNGLDFTHEAFRDKDNNCRIKRLWAQGANPKEGESSPIAFGYGTEFTTPEAILAAEADKYGNSHGSHVTNIAAGSSTYKDGAFTGMAPDADIVLVSLGDTEADKVNAHVSNAIKYIFDYATEVGKPCVVNLSLGAHYGPHDGTSPFDILADAMTGPGRLIVGSSGNHRADKFHVSRIFASKEDAPLATCIEFKRNNNFKGDIDIWVDKDAQPEIALSLKHKTTGDVPERVVVWPSEQDTLSVTLGRNMTGAISVANEVNPLNGKVHVLVRPEISGLRTTHSIVIEVKPSAAGQADIWADNVHTSLTSQDFEGFEEPGTASTIAEIGGTAKSILSVGAYTTRNTYQLINGNEPQTIEETVGDLCSFSSTGPTADGRLKPEVTAPGCLTLSAVSAYDCSTTLLVGEAADPHSTVNRYAYMQGTSMAAPVVTGVVAQWLQAYPQLSPDELKEVVKASSRADSYAKAETLPNSNWGYGKIDALAGAKECIRLAQQDGIPAVKDEARSTLLQLAHGNIDITFTSAATNVVATLYSSVGAVVATTSASAVDPAQSMTLGVGSVAPGVYVLTVKGNKVADTYKVAIK